ncbi:hypothetical protein TWF106_004146 [Orbilia oligospora]|uniref:Uncharacterized protein n=1 Tax=Orbilia oligospora TaxID=2813651 RepID=A0A6G1M7B7_ORBOL|nr:hypothetical protein TWF788_006571 [Orbilia oligospora]KAF3216908.1 hypothetical protein TWF679_002741 [Orbilia oligospora]KAF3223884.1 hypothetical protein TWF191_006298 [Orbilia oligospora]KAF3229224.1 hypothetical protein TWF106_004146 [Orbilia oligospora]KAF3248730.1 hypothetical protein TWF192_006128 [Orbilia oligospora]
MCHNILFHEDSAGCAMRGSEATVNATFLTSSSEYIEEGKSHLYQYQPNVSAPKHSADVTSTNGLTQSHYVLVAGRGRAIVNVISVFLLEDIDHVRTMKKQAF